MFIEVNKGYKTIITFLTEANKASTGHVVVLAGKQFSPPIFVRKLAF